jgi:DNA-directed RNA polymerase beta' subunit
METILSKKKLGIRMEEQKPFNILPCTGNLLIFNRLQTLNSIDWSVQARQRLKVLKKSIEVFETQQFTQKQTRFQCRCSTYLYNQIMNQLRIRIEIQLSSLNSTFIILYCLPVLSPNRRPIMFIEKRKIIVSDLTDHYRVVIRRNKLFASRKQEITINNKNVTNFYYRELLLRKALEYLFGVRNRYCKKNTSNRFGKKYVTQRIFKSISTVLSGKRGRFRNDLLGKRIDYSARSVIIPAPELALNQCGLPHDIILILFQPFFIRFLKGQLKNGYKIRSRIQARQFLHQETNERWARRTQILTEFPVLLNRAPTVHRFGFQSFQPLLSQTRAIQLHPLLCSGFNADFDGDQIAVHLPIFFSARHESWRLVIPGSLFFSPAVGRPIFLPTLDIVRGIYFLTTRPFLSTMYRSIFINIDTRYSSILCTNLIKITDLAIFFRADDIYQLFERQILQLHKFVWVYLPRSRISDCECEPPIKEIRLDQYRTHQEMSIQHLKRTGPTIHFIHATVGRVLFSFLSLSTH